MFNRVTSRLTYANVMATIGVFLGMGAASYAATNLPADSVGTPQLKPGAVTTSKLADRSVTGRKVTDGSLTGADINEATLGRVPNAGELAGLGPSAFYPAANVKKINVLVSQCTSQAPCSGTALDFGVFKINWDCVDPAVYGEMSVLINVDGPNADANWFYVDSAAGSTSSTNHGVGGGDNQLVFTVGGASDGATHLAGTITYRDDNEVVSVPFAAYQTTGFANGGQTAYATCELEGTATKATK